MKDYEKLEVDNIVEKFLSPSEARELFTKALLPDKVLTGEVTHMPDYEPTYAKRRLEFLLKMLYYTGQRPISILKLQKKDIMHNSKDGWRIRIDPVKKQKQHYIPIAKDLYDNLMKWIAPLQPDHYLFHPEFSPSKQISKHTIVTQGKALFSSYNKGKNFKEDRKEWVSFYTLRHSAATNILAATGSLKLAGTLLNHSNPKMTERYAKVLDSAVQGAVDGL
jgi:integrase